MVFYTSGVMSYKWPWVWVYPISPSLTLKQPSSYNCWEGGAYGRGGAPFCEPASETWAAAWGCLMPLTAEWRSKGDPVFWGRSPLCPPLPGKWIKLCFFTVPPRKEGRPEIISGFTSPFQILLYLTIKLRALNSRYVRASQVAQW